MTNPDHRSYEEKRDFIRMQVGTEIILTLNDSNKLVSGCCKDLSGTGMLIEISEMLAEGDICKTTLPSNNEAFPSLNTIVKVLRCTPVGENKYLLGVEIVNIES